MKLTRRQSSELSWIRFSPYGRPVAGHMVDNRSAHALERRGLLEKRIVGEEVRWVATPAGHTILLDEQENPWT